MRLFWNVEKTWVDLKRRTRRIKRLTYNSANGYVSDALSRKYSARRGSGELKDHEKNLVRVR